jgi:hypothetical protein
MLTSGTLGRAGVIRWQSEQVMGVHFDLELDAREVSAQVARSNALSARRRARP